MKKILLIVLSILWISMLVGQNCYVRLDDASGLNTDNYQAELEDAACGLISILPEEFQNNFKIYDFGFYTHQENFEGGFPEIFQNKIDEISAIHPHFILFGKQSDQSGLYTKAWVKIKLPTNENYPCANTSREQMLEQILLNQLDGEHGIDLVNRINQSIVAISTPINKVYECCNITNSYMPTNTEACEVTETDIVTALEAKQYFNYNGLNISLFPSNNNYTNIDTPVEVIIDLDDRCPLYNQGVEQFHLTDELDNFLGTISDGAPYGFLPSIEIIYITDESALNFYPELADFPNDLPSPSYTEKVFILDFPNSSPKVYFTFEIKDIDDSGFRSVGLSSWAVKSVNWFFTRAATTPAGILVSMAIEYTVEASVEYWFDSTENPKYNNWFGAMWGVIKKRGVFGAITSLLQNTINSPAAHFFGTFANHIITTPPDQWSINTIVQGLLSATINTVFQAFIGPTLKATYFLLQPLIGDFISTSGLLLKDIIKNRSLFRGWKSLFPDETLRKNTLNLEKANNYASDFGKNSDEISSEFSNVPVNERQSWINHLEFRTKNNGQVNKAGDRASDFNKFKNNSDVPTKYTNNMSRFEDLAKDPDQGGVIKTSTRREATAGLELESQGVLNGINRGPKGIEFYDINRVPYDVKTPTGNYFKVTNTIEVPAGSRGIGDAIFDELTKSKTIDGVVHPPGQFIDEVTDVPKYKKVILDCSYINNNQLQNLRNWLQNDSGLTSDQLSRIIEVNIQK